jgi:hypothetical protein
LKFSQRKGLTPSVNFLQIESMDSNLKNSPWSVVTALYWDTFNQEKYDGYGGRGDYIKGSNLENVSISLWLHYFKLPIDTIPKYYFDPKMDSE